MVPCFQCHQALSEHDPDVWPLEQRAAIAILCGACGHLLSINDYMDCEASCSNCAASFNPGCANHPGPDPLPIHCAYWEAAVYYMTFILGWSDPGAGLRWWYGAGQPTDDLHLALLDRLWNFDGQLDLLAAWLWSGRMANRTPRSLPPIRASMSQQRDAIDSLVAPWRSDEGIDWRGASPYTSDSSPLHRFRQNSSTDLARIVPSTGFLA